MHSYSVDDTIAAIATPLGVGGIGIVRLSGPRAHDILRACFVSADGSPLAHRRLVYGYVIDPADGQRVDEVLATVMVAPATYTRQDVAEIHAHGGMVALRAILALCLAQGARLAEPGEFTLRAFLLGRVDLAQAEAVLDLIRAKTDRALTAALSQLDGGLSQQVSQVRRRLVSLVAHLQAQMDFPEDEIPELALGDALAEATHDLTGLVNEAARGIILREGVRAAIVGKPNVGKSSLLNCLLRADRAIVTPYPGTTRDTLEETLDIQGYPLVLVDTAGIAEPQDPVEALGIERSLRSLERSELVLWVADAAAPLTDEDRQLAARLDPHRTLVVVNKVDLAEASKPQELLPEAAFVRVSCLTGEGIVELEAQLATMVERDGAAMGAHASAAGVRHRALFDQAWQAVRRAEASWGMGATPDLLAVDLEEAVYLLGQVTGETASEEMLDSIFGQFCIGK